MDIDPEALARGRGAGAQDDRRARRAPVTLSRHHRPARGAARRHRGDLHHRRGRPARLGAGRLHPAQVRHLSAGGRHRHARRHLARAAHDPGHGRDRPRTCSSWRPNALFFNYGNPMAPVCRAVRKATGANMVGLCHGVNHVGHYPGPTSGRGPRGRCAYTAVGMNHLTWFTEVRVDGAGHDAAAAPDRRARSWPAVPDAELGARVRRGRRRAGRATASASLPLHLAAAPAVRRLSRGAGPARHRVLSPVLSQGRLLRQDAGRRRLQL